MTTVQIITAIISSSLLSSVLTVIASWLIHRSDYKNDYYKKILDKRLEAYEQLNKVVGELSKFTFLDGNNVIHSICLSEHNFKNYINSSTSINNLTFWYEEATSLKLTELNMFLIDEIYEKLNNNSSLDSQYKSLGRFYKEELSKFNKDIQELMNKDLKTLHNLTSFFNKNK